MKKKLASYFTRRKKQIEKEESRRLGETGFLLGAALTMVSNDECDDRDILIGGITGLLAMAVFEAVCPKTATAIKHFL